ncbi:ATP-binding protein [Thermophilibacter provencensis]|uniref:ATP-binding protein n=1 Tax=Thermophilibacter provencensis TaxID=1852386 RepID=A0ABT7V4W7_9ACTN|nr:ATP-binding protein [Thermophilibacter provencensis]MDM8271014.1 ATP-binding protein [Thermophilibacter provencensis]
MADLAGDLVSFVSSMGGERALRVEESLGEGYVRLRVSEAERRQAKHDIRCVEDAVIEMLRNARDAGARRIYVATSREGTVRTTTMLDDGSGIPQDMQERVFEARVTSKLDSIHMDRWGVHGRGMALFSIKENSLSSEVVSSAPGKGAAIRVVTDSERLPERADQSTWPVLSDEEPDSSSCLRGPHNIIRTCCEFALEERSTCEVYVGSSAEIVATARARTNLGLDASELLFMDSLDELPVTGRLAAAADASDLCEQARLLGLEMSERTAHRIIVGQIRPLRSVLSRLLRQGDKKTRAEGHEVDLLKDRRGLRLSRSDLEEFSSAVERDFGVLADRYYLALSSAPKVRVGRGRITVTLELEEPD